MNKEKRYGYKFIWGPILQKNEITFALSEEVSPYLEINNDFLNEDFKSEKFTIKINPYIRFDNIFIDYIQSIKKIEEKGENEYLKKIQFKKNIENNILSYLRELDFITGTTIVDINCEYITNDIKKGVFGERFLKYFLELSVEEQKIISLLIYNNISLKIENKKSFEIGVRYFFLDSIIYINKFENKKIILYLNYEKNKKNVAKIKILEYLFLPLGISIKYYWEHHFGVLGVDETMIIEKMAVY